MQDHPLKATDPNMYTVNSISSLALTEMTGYEFTVPNPESEFDIIDSLDYEDVDDGLFSMFTFLKKDRTKLLRSGNGLSAKRSADSRIISNRERLCKERTRDTIKCLYLSIA